MRLLIAGDFCSRYRTVDIIESGRYDDALGSVRTITKKCDYSIVNLECPVINGTLTPITKQGPNLSGSEKMLDAISYMGFDCVTLANNHFLDQGENGVKTTISELDYRCIDYVGGGNNIEEASKVLYKDIVGKTLAIINCCEHEFSIATETTGGANPLNPIRQFYAIQEAKNKADYVLVIIHGGHEHHQLPSPRMVETYRFYVDAGADAVVNHHQHCFSGYEVYKGKPIFYGLGNLFFDLEKPSIDSPWNYGFCVVFDISEIGVTFAIYPYKQCAEEPKITLLDGNAFDGKLKELNDIIINPSRLKESTNKYYKNSMADVEILLNPYQNRILRGLVKLGIIPSLFKKKWLLKLENYVLCESHRDKVEYYLKHK